MPLSQREDARWKDDTGFPLTQRAVNNKIDGSAKESFEQLMDSKEVIVSFSPLGEFQVHVNITLRRGFSSGERAKSELHQNLVELTHQ